LDATTDNAILSNRPKYEAATTEFMKFLRDNFRSIPTLAKNVYLSKRPVFTYNTSLTDNLKKGSLQISLFSYSSVSKPVLANYTLN
jgi:hypothetical protein